MQYISIVGNNEEFQKKLAEALAEQGYKINRTFVISSDKSTKFCRSVNEVKFYQLVDKGIIISYENIDKKTYGTAEPFGANKFVSIDTDVGCENLRRKYGKQVKKVLINSADVYQNNTYADIIINDSMSIQEALNKILNGGESNENLQQVWEYSR